MNTRFFKNYSLHKFDFSYFFKYNKIKKMMPTVDHINALEEQISALSDEAKLEFLHVVEHEIAAQEDINE